MNKTGIYVSGCGVISSLGYGTSQTKDAILKGLKGIGPLDLFSVAPGQALPVGQVPGPIETGPLPRTHQLARLAADEAMAECCDPLDAVVLGITTGGMLTTEALLKKKIDDPELFGYHAIGSVAEDIARQYRCAGPVITVSTACSSGTVAIKIAMEMLRAGIVRRVLAGGADSLCHLTYCGFNSLQLIDPKGARPLDKDRRGMSLAEGAAMLLLVANRPENAVAEILGAGLSCDAHHPVTPHPQGKGALAAMQAAICDAAISLSDIDYINLHGTGTPENDLSEAHAINALFPRKKPLMSSIKGAFGHSLAAAGAIEAVVSVISVSSRLIPGNIGCVRPDPVLKLKPIMKPVRASIDCVLSNSFGFGGNNASVIIGRPDQLNHSAPSTKITPLAIIGCACLTGAGNTGKTVKTFSNGSPCKGPVSDQEISKNLSPRVARRLKRLSRLALSLSLAAHEDAGTRKTPSSVFFSTGWGALSETHDFLTALFETDGRFPSPTDFIGSVHNAPAGQIAMQFQSTGANITTSGGDYSFEQALMTARLLSTDARDTLFVIGADESHEVLSPIFDRSVPTDRTLSDGGGAFCLTRGDPAAGLYIDLAYYENSGNNPKVISMLIRQLGGAAKIRTHYGALLVGIPGGFRNQGEKQLQEFLLSSGFQYPVLDYRKLIGEFASASAVAAVIAAKLLENTAIPGLFWGNRRFWLSKKSALILGLGPYITAMEVFRR